LKLEYELQIFRGEIVRTHVNPHGGLKLPWDDDKKDDGEEFGPTLILTED